MDGTIVQKFFISEVSALLDTYKQFETLIPVRKEGQEGSYHKAEDGRFVENLVRSLLSKHLPKELEALTGFILRPAVKTGKNNVSRDNEKDISSTQLDIIVYDTAHYPVYLRYDDTAIVPPEGVVAIISIKKKLSTTDVKNELVALREASKLCFVEGRRKPFLAIISMDTSIATPSPDSCVKGSIIDAYQNDETSFDDTVGLIGVINKWSIFKPRPQKTKPKKVEYKCFINTTEEDKHFCLQFLISGILSVFYSPARSLSRPGYTGFSATSVRPICKFEAGLPAVFDK